jgi:adenylate cyclase
LTEGCDHATLCAMGNYDRDDLATRAGVVREFVDRLVDIGVLVPDADDRLTDGDIRRAVIVWGLEQSGLPTTEVGALIGSGVISLDFVDEPSFGVFSALEPKTFHDLSDETAIPLELLLVIRDAMGSAHPQPDDRVRATEMAIVPMVQTLYGISGRAEPVERVLRVMGDSLRRIAETEAHFWRTEIQEPLFGTSRPSAEITATIRRHAEAMDATTPDATLAIYHGQQSNAWLKNMLEAFEASLAHAGLRSLATSPPAICFLDLTGYTRLTDERGDAAAADLAATLGRLVQQTSAAHGGKPVKWLGDGVMFWFREPGRGVAAALDMIDGTRTAGLPPAHVGLHAGPVLFQEGDYFGRTVNLAARIADYARQGEVLVSQDVVDASAIPGISFDEIGFVDLKGVSESVRLSVARRASLA